MNACRFMLIAGLFLAGAAHAQLVSEQQATLEALPEPLPRLKEIPAAPRGYVLNDAVNQNDKLFQGLFKTDPRLLFGFALAPNLSFEAGYQHLYDRGFHKVNERDAFDTDGALFARPFTTHAGIKYTLPVGERLSVWGKLGLSHSALPGAQLPDRRAYPQSMPTSDTGLFVGLGAKYKVDKRTTIDARVGSHGDTARRFGSWANATGIRADLKKGF